MKNEFFDSFVKDIRDLYCRTGIKEVESIFIKLSQAASSYPLSQSQNPANPTVNSLKNWLKKSGIENTIHNKDLYYGLLKLCNIREKYPTVDWSLFLKLFFDNPRDIASLLNIARYLDNDNVNNVLYLFEDIFQNALRFHQVEKDKEKIIEPKNFYEDLYKINQEFLEFLRSQGMVQFPHKDTRKQQRMRVFSSLLNRFTNDIANVADRAGLKDLSDKLRTEGILANPNILSRYIKIYPVTQVMAQKSNQISQQIMRYPEEEKIDGYYQNIRDTCLDFVGEINLEEIERQKEEQVRQEQLKTIVYPQKGQQKNQPSMPSLTVTDAQWLSPWFLTMLSAVLYLMHKRTYSYDSQSEYWF